MKLLFVTNYYPPHHLGGYEMLCHEVAQQLEQRGHRVAVLASGFQATPDEQEPGIHRTLRLESDIHYYHPGCLLSYRRDMSANRAAVAEALAQEHPEAIVVWGMWNLSRLVPHRLEELAGPKMVYYLSDRWPANPSAHRQYWEGTATSLAGRLFKRMLRTPARWLAPEAWSPPALQFRHALVCSRTLREQLVAAGVPVAHAQVLYHGIDPRPYREAARSRPVSSDGSYRVAFVGTLAAHKGAHTAIEALTILAREAPSLPLSLSVLGSGHPDYETRLRRLVGDGGIGDRVVFHAPIPRAELPAYLARHDALVMPSVYEEPQARISQEAMAADVVLIATPTGGTKEILEDGINGLAFAPEDARGLAAQLQRVATDAELGRRLRDAAWETVSQRFTIGRMIDEFERVLELVSREGPAIAASRDRSRNDGADGHATD